MSTYQDRAREVLERYLYEAKGMSSELRVKQCTDQALSELASIVEEEIIGKDEDESGAAEDYTAPYDRNELRAKQRDQLSNRSKSDATD